MSEYLIIRAGTLDILGASWSTDLATMERLAPKLCGIPVTASFLMKRGVKIVISKPPFPRTMLVGEGAKTVALVEEKRAPYGGTQKPYETIIGHMAQGKRRKEAA